MGESVSVIAVWPALQLRFGASVGTIVGKPVIGSSPSDTFQRLLPQMAELP